MFIDILFPRARKQERKTLFHAYYALKRWFDWIRVNIEKIAKLQLGNFISLQLTQKIASIQKNSIKILKFQQRFTGKVVINIPLYEWKLQQYCSDINPLLFVHK